MKLLRTLRACLTLMLCWVLTMPAASAQTATGTESVIVELAVFSQPSARLLPAQPAELGWNDAAVILDETANAEVRSIAPARYDLSDEMERLARQGYTLQLHTAWTQPLGMAVPVAVTEGDAAGSARAQALVSLEQDTNLEAQIAFWLNHVTADGSVVSERLAQTRNIRLGETHYFDHPSLGALLRVSRTVN